MSKILVTGGGGFLGFALCQALLHGQYEVLSLSRKQYRKLSDIGVQSHIFDLSSGDPSALEEILIGVDTVIHTAAKVGLWGKYRDFYDTNVRGTDKLLRACQAAGVTNFIYTSSPSVVADGSDLEGVDENYPIPKSHHAYYPATKAIAERLVLACNDSGAFKTLALRPHLIFGPGDVNLIPTILNRAESGKLIQVGDGENEVDVCYIDDCVEAHLCALRALKEKSIPGGEAYFISQGEPVRLWDWIAEILSYYGLSRPSKKLSYKKGMFLAGIIENIHRVLPFLGEPRITRFLVSEMATSHYFDIRKAQRELGFIPKYSVSEATRLTFQSTKKAA
jgi:nucleoside-diphosphate-sugar epimerase